MPPPKGDRAVSLDQATPHAEFVRPDGKEKVTGAGRYTADLTLTGQAYARFRYTDHPHARIVRVDASRARALPGVLAVLTHEDVPEVKYGGMAQDRYLFAKDVARFEGDILAAVAATSEEIATAAVALIDVELEPLPAIDYEGGMSTDAPLVHEDWSANDRDENLLADRNTLGYSTIVKGDADAAMAGADVVVKGRYTSDPSHGVPIEPHAVIAEWQGDKVTIWSSTQVPYIARSGVAQTLRIPEANVRVIVPLLGGGFGAKCDFHFEAHVAALARAAGRPVKLVFSREEEFVAIDHRREGMAMEFETGVRRDGTIVARRARLVLDKGAYCGEGGFLAQMAAMHACGPYVIEHVFVEAYLNYSTTQPSGSVRAPAAPQVCWALEQHMDELARAVDMDPVAFRRVSLIADGSEGPTKQVFDHIAARETLDRAVELIGYGRDLPQDEAIGISCGWWPSFSSNAGASVLMNPDGSGTIVTGAQENGTGAVMAMPKYVAEMLGMRPEDFQILYQDTDAAPWDMGSSGSQTTFNAVRAVLDAADDVRSQLLGAASEKLEAAEDDLELSGGAVRVKGSPDRSVTVAEIAESTTIHGKGAGPLPDSPPVEASSCVGRLGFESFLAPQLFTHAAHVRVDRETGVVRVLRVAAVHDSGRILNRIGADGQVYGGIAMGIGMALSEGTLLDDEGRQRNPHLLDYKLVTSADAPVMDIEWIEIDTPDAGPNGSKGVGEPPCVPTAGAVANAIAAVLGRQLHELPMTPERVWRAAQDAAGAAR
jgi:CO/xanthine dehydrogenase Mo-binding subunit